jgi:L-seryl-tRNA(Ser) seleniumtransferase
MGGPQAGILAGSAALVQACRNNPLARVFRTGDLVLSALQEVLLSYLRGDVADTVPLWRMATTEVRELRSRANALGVGEVVDCGSVMGGGSVPGQEIPSVGVAVEGDVRSKLLKNDPPVLARTTLGKTVCDLRSVLPEQDADLRKALLS